MSITSRTIVTGAGGFIGKRLIGQLQAAGIPSFGWTRDVGDLTDAVRVADVVAKVKPTVIYHLAARSPGSKDFNWCVAAEEVVMFSNLLQASPPSCVLIVAGSMAEFGSSGIFSETTVCRPDSAYGFAKHSVVNAALAVRNLLGRDVRVARLFGVYGPGESANRLLPFLVDRLMQNEHVPLSDGEQVRDFVHVDDVCRVLLALALSERDDISLVNVGSGTGVRVKDVCLAVARFLDRDPGLLGFGEKPRRNVDQQMLVADTSMLQTLTTIPAADWPSSARAQQHVLDLAGNLSAG